MSAGRNRISDRFGGYHLFNYAPALIFLLSDKIVGVDNFVFGEGGGGREGRGDLCVYAHVDYLVKSLIKAFPGGRNRSRVGLVPRNPH